MALGERAKYALRSSRALHRGRAPVMSGRGGAHEHAIRAHSAAAKRYVEGAHLLDDPCGGRRGVGEQPGRRRMRLAECTLCEMAPDHGESCHLLGVVNLQKRFAY